VTSVTDAYSDIAQMRHVAGRVAAFETPLGGRQRLPKLWTVILNAKISRHLSWGPTGTISWDIGTRSLITPLSLWAAWDFEVWNEPNFMFWSGTQADYFELYRRSAAAIKQVDKRLRVGGPSTAYAGWVSDFLKFCISQQLPVDFVSTHIYPDDAQKLVFATPSPAALD
jgi:hypothetical protein